MLLDCNQIPNLNLHFFLSSVNEAVSRRKAKLLWYILFKYSKMFNLFSEERIPLTLFKIELPILLDITSFFNRQ